MNMVKTEADKEEKVPPNYPFNEDREEQEEDLEQGDTLTTDEVHERILAIQEGAGEAYDPSQEALPDLPAYRPAFRRVQSLCEMLFEQAAMCFLASKYKDEFTQRLVKSIEELKTPNYRDVKVLAFQGDSGVGKSSLINSILDSPYLSAQGDTGGACTCVITEYRNASESQKTPFVAEVEFYPIESIERMLREQYANYFKFFVQQPPDLDEDELQQIEAHATTAKDNFNIMLADRPEFETTQLAKKYLHAGKSEKDETILKSLISWAKELINRYSKNGKVVLLHADTAEDLSKELEPFTEVRNDSTSCWPLVRLVRVWLRSPLLARGLVIADLPGLSDTNRTRQRTTNVYLRSCAYIVIVAQVKRVLTDENTHRRLSDAVRRPGKTKLLICTMIDEIDRSTKISKLSSDHFACMEHQRLFNLYKDKKEENNQFSKKFSKLKGREKSAAKSEKQDRAEYEYALESIVVESLVNLRNNSINQKILDKYLEQTDNARSLALHFVSNRDYATHLEGYDSTHIPLPVSSTGIPRLRYRLSSIPAEDRLNVLEHYYKVNLRSVLDKMSLWSSQTPLKRQTDLKKAIEKPRKLIGELVEEYIRDLRRIFTTIVIQKLDKAYFGEWKEKGLERWESWNQMRALSFSAWCRWDGVHETPAMAFRDWNRELLEAVTKSLIEIWNDLKESFAECKDKFFTRVFNLLDGIRSDLQAIPGVSLLPITPFLRSLTTKKDHIRKEMRSFSNAFDEVATIAFNIGASSDHDSALMEAMLPIYHRLVEVRGKQQGNQRKHLLKEAMDKGEPFSKISLRINECFQKFLDDQEKYLLPSMVGLFDEVVRDFDLQSTVNEKPDQGRDDLKGDIKEFLVTAEESYNGLIASEFARAIAPVRNDRS